MTTLIRSDYNQRAITLLIIACLISAPIAPLEANTGFPRWYNALLSLHMPHWLIKILENPWLIASAAGIFFITKVIIFSYLSAKLLRERKKNKNLSSRCEELMNTINEMRKDNEHHKAITKHLTETLIHVSVIRSSEAPLHAATLEDKKQQNTRPKLPQTPTIPL